MPMQIYLRGQQANWLRLVADDQPAVAGLAITQLQTLEKAKRIDAESSIADTTSCVQTLDQVSRTERREIADSG